MNQSVVIDDYKFFKEIGGMSITKRGPNKFLVRVYVRRDPITGKRIEVNETVRGPFSLARKKEAQLKGQKESGSLIKFERTTVNDLLDSYLDSNRHRHSVNTQNKNKKYLNYYVRGHIGHARIEKLRLDDIQKLFNFLLDKRLASSTVKGVKKVLHAAFNYAVKNKRIAENPVSETILPPLNKSSANSLTPKEANAFIAVKDKFHYGDAFVFQLHSGLRPQELLALIWDDIDFKKGTVRVERSCKWLNEVFVGFGRPKTRRSERTIKLSPEVLKLLRRHYKKQQKLITECEASGSEYGEPRIKEWIAKERPKQAHLYTLTNLIFPSPYGCVPQAAGPRLEFKAMLRKARIKRYATFRWYDLRHTHATFLLIAGVHVHEVAERLGNTTNTMLTTYAHVLPERRKLAATSLQKIIPI